MPRVGDRFRNVEAEEVPAVLAPSGTVWEVVDTEDSETLVLTSRYGSICISPNDLAHDFEPVAETQPRTATTRTE